MKKLIIVLPNGDERSIKCRKVEVDKRNTNMDIQAITEDEKIINYHVPFSALVIVEEM